MRTFLVTVKNVFGRILLKKARSVLMACMLIGTLVANFSLVSAGESSVQGEAKALVRNFGDSTNHWGYGYDSLLRDIEVWRKSPFVNVDSIGVSVEGRTLWMISISAPGDSLGGPGDMGRKHRVFLHVRTHPSEVQVGYVAREAIRFLTDSTSAAAATLRAGYLFNFVPMYNPDGVMLGHSRLNAHLVDLEGNWDKPVMEPEPQYLRATFQRFMGGPIPIDVALNLHSDTVNCSRFFFYHVAAGTSEAYTVLEKSFIAKTQAYFPDSIRSWNFLPPQWTTGPQARYPEGFWWLNYHESVMALTYEDSNCPDARAFDSTGRALVLGATDYIRSRWLASIQPSAPKKSRLVLAREGIRIDPVADVDGTGLWELRDVRGRVISTGAIGPAGLFIPWSAVPNTSPVLLIVREGRSGHMNYWIPATPR